MARTHWKRLIGALSGLAVTGTVGAAILVGSGEVAVVTTSGVSMQPTYHQGDLVVVRASDYGVGDVVAYRDPQGRTVLHRIIGRDGDRLRLQGDNNDWVDQVRPRTSDVVGEAWFHVPRGGSALRWLRGPLPAGAMVAALGMMITRSAPEDGRRRMRTASWTRSAPTIGSTGQVGSTAQIGSTAQVPSGPPPYRGVGQRPAAPPRPPMPDAGRARAGLRARTLLGGAGVLLVVALGAGALAFARPTETSATRRLSYEHHGALSYRADVPSGAVYEDGRLRTGDPIFLDLTDSVDVRYDYRLSPGALRDVSGTVALAVELSSSNGWTRTVPLGEPVELRGAAASVDAPLDLVQLRGLLAEVEEATGISGGTYTVTLVPTVEVAGYAAGEQVRDDFTTRHELALDRNQLRPRSTDTLVEVDGEPVLRTDTAGAVTTDERRDATFSILGRHVAVGMVRVASLVAGGAAVVLLLAGLVYLRVAGPRTAADRIRAKYGRRIVDVDGGEGGEARTIIDVSTMEALVRLADHHDRLILHHRSDSGDTFMVDAHDTLYRHRVALGQG